MPRKKNPDSRPRDKLLYLYQRLTLDGGRHFQAKLAADLKCAPQTVSRLIGVIEQHLGKDAYIESGLEDRRRYYRLRSGAEEKALGFSFEELRFLATCRDIAAPHLPAGVVERINRSLTFLALQLGENGAHGVSGAPMAFHGKGYIDYGPHLQTIGILNQAIEKRQVCRVAYRANGRQEETTYRYAPGRMLAMSGALYALGYQLPEGSLIKDRPTTFLLHRIVDVVPTEEYFSFNAAEGDARTFGLNWHEQKRMRVRVAPEASDYVRDRVWSEDQTIIDLDDGGLILEITTTSEKELNAWVWSFGGLATVLEIEP